ncbi:MAG: phytoene desaturase [Spirochaetes bacterium]|nr:phytoene desaturase [Spirochaetota bacterium]
MVKKCCVIGAGLGGLSAAIEIALLGIEVDLFEQNETAGGKAGSIFIDGFRFDTGPSLLTMPFVLESIFNDSGKNINNYLTIKPLESHCAYFFPDGTEIIAFSDLQKFAAEIINNTSDNKINLITYLNYCRDIYELTADLFLFNDFHDCNTFKKYSSFRTLLNIRKIDSMRTMHKANSSFFKDPKTIQLFDRYATYNGSNPYLAPATLNIIPHVEYNMGSYIVEQGIYAVSESLAKLAGQVGVNIYTNKRVNSILHNDGKVSGILVNNEKINYDFVVSNADASVTYAQLLNDIKTKNAKRYAKLEPSSSAMVFYWGMDYISSLGIHNIIFSEDYQKEFHEIFNKSSCPNDPTVYIYISSKFKSDDALPGTENWFVMINAPYDKNQDWEHETTKSRDRIINKINRTLNISIESKIRGEQILTPPDIERKTSSHKGSLYGISSNSRTAAFLRQSNKSKQYKGLYFCGGSVHPGGGIPLVLLSGKLAARAIAKDLSRT